jgi:alpha-L-rhamnosidase
LHPSRFLLTGSAFFALLLRVPCADAGQLRNQMPARQSDEMSSSTPSSGIVPVNLKAEDSVNPLGIDADSPQLSWILQPHSRLDRGLAQSAYQILVAPSPQVLARNQGDVWDSGKVLSSITFNVPYAGPPLVSLQTYYWKLAVWDQTGHESNWSQPARWTTSILRSEGWTAHWIAATADTPPSAQPRENFWEYRDRTSPLPVFRRAFSLDKPVRRALVLISGLGQYELHVNGRPVTESALNPGWTDYRKTIFYNSWDVTPLLKRGANALGILLGNGMYNVEGIKGRYTKFIGSFGQPKLLLQMQIDFTDGSSKTIVSDGSWKTIPGPIVFSSIYGREDYDARLEQQGWDRPGFQDATWAQAIEVGSPGGQMVSQMLPPTKVTTVLSPRTIIDRRSGTRIYDLGQNISGWPEIVVRGLRGAKIEITAGELLDRDGRVTQHSANARPGSANLFSYTLKGTGDEAWHPRFSYYGFRYIQVTEVKSAASSNRPVLLALKGGFVHADAVQVGKFSTSNPLFMRIHRLIDMAILSNMVSILTDCPQREKLGWLEQTYLAGSAIFFNYDVAPLYRKVARDMRDAQLPNGMIPSIAPEYLAFVDKQGNDTDFRDSPEWGSAVVLSPWTAYGYTGDRALLADSYEAMARYLAYLRSRLQDNMLTYGLGDWYDIGPNPPGESQLTSKALTATAIYYQDLGTLSQIAQLLNKPAEAQSFQKEADRVRSAMNDHLLRPDTGLYDRGSQTASAMSLVLGIVPDDLKATVMNRLVENVREHGNHVTTGDIGFHYEVRALTNGGRSDVLNDLLSRTDSPSYEYQLAKGATTLTEAWDTNQDSSQNHFMLGHAEEWFYRGLAGIDFDLSRPFTSRIVIRPSLVAGTREAFARYDSVLGRTVGHWSRNATNVTLDITIPPGSSATIYLPTNMSESVRESGRPLRLTTGIQSIAFEDGRVQCVAGSGEYHFLLPVNGMIPEN